MQSDDEFPRRLEWLVLIALFLLAGIFGHDPWKQDETYTFGIIHHFYLTHEWLVPVNGGEAFLEKPPLYYWTGVLFCDALGGVLPLHDAARCASVFYMLIAILFMLKLAQLMPNRHLHRDCIALALFLGCLGLVRHAHDMFTDVALLAGTTIAFYGMMLLMARPNCWKHAGLWLGLGAGVAFMSKGFWVPVFLGVSFATLWALTPALRARQTWSVLLIAFVVAAPFLLIWPIWLYMAQGTNNYFHVWFWDNNLGRFFGNSVPKLGAANTPHFFLSAVLWFAFPAFPLACIEAVRGAREWRRPEYIFPLTVSVVGMAILLASASGRALYLMPLLPVFALLATQALERVPPLVLQTAVRVLRIFFSAGGVFIWFVWWYMKHPAGVRPWPTFRLDSYLSNVLPPDYVSYHTPRITFIAATFAMTLWLFSLRLNSRTAVNAAYTWLAGVALIWVSVYTLLLPWMDYARSYRAAISDMKVWLGGSPYRHECIGGWHLGESIAPMLEYFGDAKWGRAQELNGPCSLILTDAKRDADGTADLTAAHWTLVWKGERVLDTKDSELRLYAKQPHDTRD